MEALKRLLQHIESQIVEVEGQKLILDARLSQLQSDKWAIQREIERVSPNPVKEG